MNNLKNDFIKEVCQLLNCCSYQRWKGHSNIFELLGNEEDIYIYVLISGTETSKGWRVSENQIEKLKNLKKKWFLILLGFENKRYCLTLDNFNDFLSEYGKKISQGSYEIWRYKAFPLLNKYIFNEITEIIK